MEKRKAGGSSPQPRRKPHSEVVAAQIKDVLQLLLVFRFVNALCVRTFFQPDEYFQALEPAWNLAFGDGSGAWLTWVRIDGLSPTWPCSQGQTTTSARVARCMAHAKLAGMAIPAPLVAASGALCCRLLACGQNDGSHAVLSCSQSLLHRLHAHCCYPVGLCSTGRLLHLETRRQDLRRPCQFPLGCCMSPCCCPGPTTSTYFSVMS